ncbi:MAG: NlpC/P60 family protein [Clostridium sp.]|nr:NlpC/P60 family protein [Clostridium sp.]
MTKKILSCALALGIIFSVSSQVLADPLQDQLNSAKDQYNQSQSNLSDAQKKADQLESSIEGLDNQIGKNMTQIGDLNGKVKDSQANIALSEKSIQKTKADMQTEKNLYDQRIKAVYVNGVQGYISVLFDSKNLGDFLSKMSIIENVTKADIKTMDNFADKQQELQDQKNQLASNREALVATQKEIQQKQDSLNAQKAQEAPLVAQANNQVALYANATASQKTQIDAITKQASDAQAAAQKAVQAQAQQTATTAVSVSNTNSQSRQSVHSVTPSPSPSPSPVPTPAVSHHSGSAVSVAESFVGVPYVYGGESTSGFDCSGLVQYSFAQVGISLPRTSEAQMSCGQAVSGSLQSGDLLFFEGGGHVAIYVGNGLMVEAPHTGANVPVVPVRSYCAARRL